MSTEPSESIVKSCPINCPSLTFRNIKTPYWNLRKNPKLEFRPCATLDYPKLEVFHHVKAPMVRLILHPSKNCRVISKRTLFEMPMIYWRFRPYFIN